VLSLFFMSAFLWTCLLPVFFPSPFIALTIAIATVIALMSIRIMRAKCVQAAMNLNTELQRLQRRLPPESNLPEVGRSGNVSVAVQGVSSNEGNPSNSGGAANEAPSSNVQRSSTTEADYSRVGRAGSAAERTVRYQGLR